jgi:hypothetical protein
VHVAMRVVLGLRTGVPTASAVHATVTVPSVEVKATVPVGIVAPE